MYIYELPFEVNKELCRLLDNYDYWEELAGNHMKYSALDVIEIKKNAKHNGMSPTNQLLIRWGQLNHKVEELFLLLYRMQHVPALRCLSSIVDVKFVKLLKKLESKRGIKNSKNNGCNGGPDDKHIYDKQSLPLISINNTSLNGALDPRKISVGSICEVMSNDPILAFALSMEMANKSTERADGSCSSIPLPVVLIDQGVYIPNSSHGHNGNSPSVESSTDTSRNSSSTQDGNDDAEILKNVSAIPKMSYEDLRDATNNWSNSNLLGRGGFGQVFKGEWKHLPVAVKRLRDNEGRNKELIREMCLNQYRHDNILPLYGYSIGGPEVCLVYQLMMGGSLEQRLKVKTHHPPLTWHQRYRIAHGVARGLQYLHNMAGTPLIHGDIKPANILLDQCLMPKIGDFGLARKGPYGVERTHFKVSRVYGTRPYLPDEYLRSHCLSPAVDVFSFGVVAAEMASALSPLDNARPSPLLSAHLHALYQQRIDFAILEDPVLKGTANSNPNLCREFMSIALHCTKYSRYERPTMLDVYKRLDALEFPGKNFEQDGM